MKNLVYAVLALGFVATTQNAEAQSEDTYKIGMIASQTGAAAFLGDPFYKSAVLAVERANAAGGINGKKIELIGYDDETSPDKALNFAKRLVFDDKVAVIVGPSLSSTARAILPTTECAGVPVIYNTPITEPPAHSFQFSAWPSEEASYRVTLEHMKKVGVKKLAALAMTDTTGESGLKQLQTLAPEYGIEIVAAERISAQDKDVTPQLSTIKGAEPDAVYAALSGASVAIVCRGYIRLGMTQPIAFSTGAVSLTWPDILKGITPQTLIFPTYKVLLGPDVIPDTDASHAQLVEYFKAYQGKYNLRPDSTGGTGYDSTNLAIAALREGGNDRMKVRTALEGITGFVGTNAVITFTPDHHRGAAPSEQMLGQFKDGKFLPLAK